MNKIKQKLNLFELYAITINSYKLTVFSDISDDKIKEDMESFLSDIFVFAEYMLFSKSLQAKPKVKKGKKIDHKSVDLHLYLGEAVPVKKSIKKIELQDVIKLFKNLEGYILRESYSNDVISLELGDFVENGFRLYDNLPKLLVSIYNLDRNKQKRMLTLLFSSIRIYRNFKTKASPKISTITDPYKGEDLDKILDNEFSSSEISKWLDSFSNQDVFNEKLKILMYSGNASSPNSSSSSSKLINDLNAVWKDERLRDAIKRFVNNFENAHDFNSLIGYLSDNIDYFELEETDKEDIHSRLFTFTASGGKSRVIANVDWVTQTALSAVHFYLFKLLSTLKSDFTFQHKSGLPYIASNKSENYYSIDLSAATDRMPRLIQSQILKHICNKVNLNGDSIAENWLIIVDREFSTANSGIKEVESIRYSVGQGMGMFASWPLMALTHHFIVNQICKVSVDNYCLVGDDLVITDKNGYHKYVNFMNKIGMTVNLQKTIISENKTYHNIEFASNFMINGHFIEPLNYGILYAWKEDKTSFESFIYSRSNDLDEAFIINLMAELKISDLHQLACIFLFLTKKKLFTQGFKEILIPLLPVKLPDWFLNIDYQKITEIIKPEMKDKGFSFDVSKPNYMLQTLQSDLIVRNPKDIPVIKNLAEYMTYLNTAILNISSTEMLKEVNMVKDVYARLINVDLITYDIDEFGNPLVTKRERKLLKDIIDLHKKLDRPKRVQKSKKTD